jgi:hypothetical protein
VLAGEKVSAFYPSGFDPLGYFSRLATKQCPFRDLGNGILQGKFPRKNQGFPHKRVPNRLFIIVSMGVEGSRVSKEKMGKGICRICVVQLKQRGGSDHALLFL